ncbi:MAG: flagellar protein FlgN [Moraxellaceae bacterium]|nr:flagellar protein FlgN [Moraxellaceae bacterium]MDP1775914.1 flagellar protein FlgN [Moraxellaceae bacterium]MDZ4296758.1 flagellar protein FlgN [Moraxellaceae bacterium]MDZ4387045.1 flagellar protein FlgN [Moraxellaceae bacterium]
MTQLLQRLADTVNHLTELACQLTDALHQQLTLLNGGSAHELSNSSDTVAQLTMALNSTDQQRTSILASLGLNPQDLFDPAQVFAQHPLKDQVVVMWQRCYEALQECQQLNWHSGLQVKLQARQTEAALAILLDLNNNTQLYDPKGKTHKESHGHRLGLA